MRTAHVSTLLAVVALAACSRGAESAAPAPAGASSGSGGVIDGGTLSVDAMPEATVRVVGDALEVWGMTEVPAGSRMQAALAMVDTITRGELVKFVQVRVESLALDVSEVTAVGDVRQEITVQSMEAARAAVPSATPLEHGWKTVERDGVSVLRIVARLRVDRATVARTLAGAFGPEGAARAEAIVARLFAP